MSQISLKSISGITSITTPTGVDNQFTLHTNNTTEAIKLDHAGNFHIHNHVNTTGVSTASGFNAGYVDVDNFLDVGTAIKLGNAGIITATSADINGDLDVDGHTNLDNVSIAGVTTFSTGPVVPNGTYYKGIINSGSQQKIVGGYISGSDTLRLGESMYLTGTGLGINKSSPATKLHIVGGTASGTAYDAAVFAGGQNSTQNSGVKLYLTGCENDPLNRGVILESIMTDNSNAHRFSVKVSGSSAAPTERFRLPHDGRAYFFGNQSSTPNGIFGFRYDRNNDTDLSIENLNNSSVNNNAGIRLASNHGNIKLRYFNNGGFYITNSSDSGYLHYYEGSNSRFYVSTNGNIGINETSPQQLLHVHNDTNYQGILINGNVAPRIAFARTTTTTGEWSVGIDGTNGNNFAINNSNDNSNNKIIISSSQVSLYGHVGVPNGNIIMGSGRGIDFSATADATHTAVTSGHNPSTDSEVLTDYEHGTWTPRLRAYDHTGGAGWGTMVYTDGTEVTGTGRYVKVGRYVWCGFKFESGSKVFDSGWTYWSIDNVPYGANHYDKASGSCYVNQTNFFTDSNSHIGGFVHGSDAYMIVNKPNGHSNATINTSNNNRYCYGHISIYSSRY